MHIPVDNVFGVPPGVALSVSDGYNYIIAPPPPEEYEITSSAVFENDGAVFEGTVSVIVEAARIIEPDASPGAGTPEATPGP